MAKQKAYSETYKGNITPEGGFFIMLTNGTGADSVKGTLVACSTTADNQFVLEATRYDTFGVVYDNGVPNGKECRVVLSGRAQVLFKNSQSATRGYVVLASDTAGRAYNINVPSSNPGQNEHFMECGHVLESKDAGTNVLVYCILHFN
jgi:hypothetical protein